MPEKEPGFSRLYPFKGRFAQIRGCQMHYLDEGTGEPVLMLHGNPTWSFMFRDLVRALSPSHRVLVPDHVGCGFSEKPPDTRYGYRLADRIADLEELLDKVGVADNITLVMHDWGGIIGLGLATRRPERIRRIVVLNTAPFLPENDPRRLHWSIRFCQKSRLAEYLILRFNLFARAAVSFCSTRNRMSEDVRRGYLLPYDTPPNRLAIARFVQDIPLSSNHPSRQELDRINSGLDKLRETPLAIFWGARDFVFDTDFLQEWIRRFPSAQVVLFEKSGHFVLEDSGDEIIPRVQEFIARSA